jgi:hypothetical protein
MGYIGLLLNAPYKIDSMMGCVCGLGSSFNYVFPCMMVRDWAILTRSM